MFFKRKDKKDNLTKLYEMFLDNIDDISQIRLRGYDLSFNNFKNKLMDDGLNLTEVSCKGKNILIKRNKKGFYLVKSDDIVLNKENIKLFNKHKVQFDKIHNYLLDKEYIMRGNYSCRKKHIDELRSISEALGYGEKRDKILDEKR